MLIKNLGSTLGVEIIGLNLKINIDKNIIGQVSDLLSQFSVENNFPLPHLNSETINILSSYSWPGNIRELRNFCENLVVLNRGGEISPYDLDARFFSSSSDSNSNLEGINTTLSVEENEKRLLRNALLQAGGNRTKAAQLMGVSRRTLHRKLVRWPELDTNAS